MPSDEWENQVKAQAEERQWEETKQRWMQNPKESRDEYLGLIRAAYEEVKDKIKALDPGVMVVIEDSDNYEKTLDLVVSTPSRPVPEFLYSLSLNTNGIVLEEYWRNGKEEQKKQSFNTNSQSHMWDISKEQMVERLKKLYPGKQ